MRHSWVDGERATTVPLDDRGLNYADGAFETLVSQEGRVACRSQHEERLEKALSALRFEAPQSQAKTIFEKVEQCLLQVAHTGPARLTVTRGSGPRGYAPPRPAFPRFILTTAPPIEHKSASWRCGIAAIRWQDQPQLAGLKLLARTEQVLAAEEASRHGWDDVLMLDGQDRVISSSRGNVFLIRNQVARTPSLGRSGIAGTRRQLLIETVLPQLGYEVCVESLTMNDVLMADYLIISNTVIGAMPVRSINQHEYPAHKSAGAIADALQELIK